MKKLVCVLIMSGMICLYGCTKTPDNTPCTNTPPALDSTVLVKFAVDSIKLSMEPTWDSSGIYYHIIDSGSATNRPVYNSQITVDYIGRLMNNSIFDSASNTNLLGNPIDELLLGWRVGMLKIGVGGHIQLFIPSALGYGCTGYGPVPPDAPLFYDVKLLGVN
jgi:FKBP-type peptidyl-prolyl cis-trans isomerase FkpA